jgi:hypothetical protein
MPSLHDIVLSILALWKTAVPWVGGIALFVGFLLTFLPSRPALIFAAVLWSIGIYSTTGWEAYMLFFQGQMAHSFSGEPFPLFAWLIPLTSVLLAVAESMLLFPWVPQKRALWIGKVLFLVVVPAVVLLTALPKMHGPFYWFPLGASWLAYPLLWFRIREKLNDRAATLGAN